MDASTSPVQTSSSASRRAAFADGLATLMRLQERLTRVEMAGDDLHAYRLAEAELMDAQRRFFRAFGPAI